MRVENFAHFIRINYPKVEISNEDCIEVGKEFKKYLIDKFKDNMNNLEKFWDIDMMTVIKNQGNPVRPNGYHLALILHFDEFIKLKQNENS